MKRLYYLSFVLILILAILLVSGCKSRSGSPIESKWKVIEVKGANPDIFMNEIWDFKKSHYSVEGLSLGGKYELGTDDDKNTIILFPNNRTAVHSAGIYEVRENGNKLIMKLGNAENDKPTFPKDFDEDIAWYDVYVCEKQ